MHIPLISLFCSVKVGGTMHHLALSLLTVVSRQANMLKFGLEQFSATVFLFLIQFLRLLCKEKFCCVSCSMMVLMVSFLVGDQYFEGFYILNNAIILFDILIFSQFIIM